MYFTQSRNHSIYNHREFLDVTNSHIMIPSNNYQMKSKHIYFVQIDFTREKTKRIVIGREITESKEYYIYFSCLLMNFFILNFREISMLMWICV